MTENKSDLPPEIANDHSYQDFAKERYPTWKLVWESIYLAITVILWVMLVRETTANHNSPLTTLIGFIVSQLLVDYVSGFMHWAGDTWGTLRTPVFGTALIGPFRMHHVDPQDICIHSFMETNAASAYPMPPFLIACLMLSSGSFLSQTINWTIVFGVPLGILTNECHKWAHMVHSKPSKPVRFLQQAGFIISP
jgi:ubiquitin-conjugating enzyme E2 variant